MAWDPLSLTGDWTATIDDPSTWTRPWTFGMPLTADPHGVLAFECHEGNYGLRNILSAARSEERQATASVGPSIQRVTWAPRP